MLRTINLKHRSFTVNLQLCYAPWLIQYLSADVTMLNLHL